MNLFCKSIPTGIHAAIRATMTLILGLALPSLTAFAAGTDTWVGNSGASWNTAANWTTSGGSTPPANGDSLVFGAAGSSGTSLNNNISSLTINKLTFNSGASSFTFGGNGFTLGTGGIDASALTSGTETINGTVKLATGLQRWTNGTGATLAFGSLGAGADAADLYSPYGAMVILSKTGTYKTTTADGWGWMGGAVGGTGILGPGMVIDNGNNTYDWASVGSQTAGTSRTIGVPTYTSAPNNSQAHNVLVTTNISVTGSGGNGWASLLVSNATLTLNTNAQTLYTGGIILEKGGTITGQPIYANSEAFYIYVPDTGTISSIVQGGGKLLYKAGLGTLTLSGANSYSGGTVVYEGTVALGASGSISSSPSITVSGGAMFDASAVSGFTLTANQNILGSGVVKGSLTTASTSKLYPGTDGTAGMLSFSNSLTMTAGSTFNVDVSTSSGSGNDQVIVANTVTLNSTVLNITALSGAANLDTNDYVLVRAGSIIGSPISAVNWVGTQPGNSTNFSILKSGSNLVLHYRPTTPPCVWIGGGADNNWSTSPNWSPVAPGLVGDTLTFAGATRTSPNMDTNYSVASVTFDSTAASFTLGTANRSTLTLTGSGVTNNSPNAQTVNVPITMNGAKTFYTAAGTLTVNSNIVNAGADLTAAGVSNIVINAVISGSGGVTQNGSGTLTLSKANTYTGVTTVNNGTVAVPTGGQINSSGFGNLIVVGNTVGQDSSFESGSVVPAMLSISGGAVNAITTNGNGAWDNYMVVGPGLNYQGFINMSSGSLSPSRHFILGNNGGYGAMTMSGGTLTVGSYFPIGFSGGSLGVFNQTGGSVTQNQIGGNGSTLIGSGGGSIGVMNVSGGTFTATAGGIYLPENDTSTGILNISGTGTVNVGNAGIRFGNSSSAVAGTLNLLGGTLTTTFLQQVGGNSTVNFNGGTLKASGANTTFMQGLGAAYVYGGGGTINDNGFAITVGQPLLSPAGNGVSATGLSITPGSGYVDTPIVTISGGGGSGATAVATVSGGQVTGITITSPGTRYTSFPMFTLSGGGGTGAGVAQGSATLVADTSGGLTKLGAGTLSLGASNTYAGATVIKTGTLALTGSGDINGSSIIISNGATFNVSAVSFTLKNGQSLLGRGVVSGSMTAASGSAIYPGTDGTFGTNTFNNNLTFASGATSFFDIGTTATGTNDRINVGGNLTANSTPIHLKAPSASVGIATNADYILLAVTGTVSGNFISTPAWDVAPTNANQFIIVTDSTAKQVRLHYTTSTSPSGAGFGTPSNPSHYQNVTLNVMATPGSSPISSVVVDLSALGLSSSQVMTGDGTGTNFNYSFTVGPTAQVGSYALPVTIIDSQGLSGSASIPLTITAADLVWDGGGANDNWNTAANWAGNVPPGSGDILTFAGTTRPTPFLEGNYTIPSLTFDPTAGSFNLGSAGSTLTLSGSLVNNSFSAQTISAPMSLSGTATFATSLGTLTVNSGISGSGDLVKSGTGLLVLSGTNAYSGNTVINGGTLRVTGTGQLYVGPVNNAATIYVNTNATLELDTWFDGSGLSLGKLGTAARQIVVDGGTIRMKGVTGYGRGVTVNAGGATFEAANGADWFLNIFTDDGGFVCNGDPDIVFTGAGVGSFDKAITGGGSLIKRGTGTWTVGRPQFYTGSTVVEQGQLCLRKPYLTTNSTVSISQGAVLKLLFYDGDAIGALVLGGTNMPPGTYSRATHPQFLIGPGSLVVGGTTNIDHGVPFTYGLDAGTAGTGVPYVMATAQQYHNDWGFEEMNVWAYYDPGIPTAQSNYGGPIGFGGLITVYTAMHEINHCLGSGTAWTYPGGLWWGAYANNLIRQIDGPTAYITGGGIHFWPYNFNYGNEWSDRNGKVAVRIIEAMRRDMGMLNQPPTVSSIANQSIPVNGNTGALPFTVSDAQTAAGSLTVTASSSNTNLVPSANIILGGSGANRTVTVTPANGQSGVASVTLQVNDGMDAVSMTFVVVVGSYTWNVADGNWDTSTPNWTGANTVWPTNGAIANFGGSGHTVTVLPGINAFGVNFNATGYLIQGNPLTFGGQNTIVTASNVVATITAGITGDGGLIKAGAGTLSLSGVNAYVGTTMVNQGTLNHSGSLGISPAAAANQLMVNNSGANATFSVSAPANIQFNNNGALIGNNAAGAGAFYQSGGNISGISQFQLGAVTGGSYGYYNLSGGTNSVTEYDLGGFNGASVGVCDMSGGVLNISSYFVPARGGSGTIGILNMTGGTLNYNGPSGQFLGNWSSSAKAVLNIANASLIAQNANVNLMQTGSSGNLGEINLLTGGLLQANSIAPGAATGGSYVNFNGGTLMASTATTTFLTANNTAANIYAGGGTINNNGVNITIPVALQAPAGSGLNGSVTVNNGGSGYIGAPVVTISGGGGTGASAYATISGGVVTGVVISSPGTGYTSRPTLTLTGGGGSGATATAPNPTPNTSGGLTFLGSGTTTLASGNTYGGSTTINGGTLRLSPPVLRMTFDNVVGSTVKNQGSGGSAMDGTLTGTATITSGGRFGNALSIPGGSDSSAAYLLITNSVVSLNTAGNWSIGLWVKTSTAGGAYLYQGDGGWADGNTTFYLNTGTTTGTKAGGVRYGQGWEQGTATINNGQWHFIVFSVSGGAKAQYVDGVLDALTVNSWGGNGTGGQLRIGGTGTGEGDGQVGLNGLIDEVYVFDRALTLAEIQLLYNANKLQPLPMASPVSVASGAILDVNGTSPSIASLSGAGKVTNGSPFAATLTLSHNTGTATFSGSITDQAASNAVSVVQAGAATSIFSGANTYRGTTTIQGGTLLVNGSLGTNTVAVANGGTLGGSGTINGTVIIQNNGILSPGTGIGTLAVSSATLQPGGTTFMEIGKSLQTNDQLRVTGALTLGGTLTVMNLSGTLAANDSFQLFSAGSTGGLFSATNLPALSPGLGWNFNSTSGVLTVIQTVATNPSNITYTVGSGTLTLSWPADHTGWRLQAQTNSLNTGLGANWFDVPGSSSTNSVTLPVDMNNGSVFYRLIFP